MEKCLHHSIPLSCYLNIITYRKHYPESYWNIRLRIQYHNECGQCGPGVNVALLQPLSTL